MLYELGQTRGFTVMNPNADTKLAASSL